MDYFCLCFGLYDRVYNYYFYYSFYIFLCFWIDRFQVYNNSCIKKVEQIIMVVQKDLVFVG